jgi:hypothetical protein
MLQGANSLANKMAGMRKWLLSLLILAGPVSARNWYDPIHEGERYVNPHLTVQRASQGWKDRWQGQLVLWTGKLSGVKRQGEGWSMRLETPAGSLPVTCPRAVLTLRPDPREGCQVSIKGEVYERAGKLSMIGRSVILLHPAQTLDRSSRSRFLASWIRFHCPDEGVAYAEVTAQSVLEHASKNGLDPWLLSSLLQIESAYRKDVVSSSGAVGLGQLMPATAAGLGVDPWDPAQNVAGCAKMLAGLLSGWDSKELDARALTLASYNAGPTLVRQIQTVPRIPETSNYVYFIGSLQKHLQALAPAR